MTSLPPPRERYLARPGLTPRRDGFRLLATSATLRRLRSLAPDEPWGLRAERGMSEWAGRAWAGELARARGRGRLSRRGSHRRPNE